MRLNPLIMETMAGDEEYTAGRELYDGGNVRLDSQGAGFIRYTVAGKPAHTVTLDRELAVRCDCDIFSRNGCCRHVIAAWLEAERSRVPESALRRNAPERGGELITLIQRRMPSEATVRLEVTLALPRRQEQPVRIGLRTGENKLYVVRDISAFLEAVAEEKTLAFGRDFTWQPEWMRYSDGDMRILNLLRKMLRSDAGDERKGSDSTARMASMPDLFVHELLDHLGDSALRVMDMKGKITACRQIRESMIPLQFELGLGPRGMNLSARMPADLTAVTQDCCWVMTGGTLNRVPAAQQELIRFILKHQYEGRCLFEYPPRELGQVIGEILPYLKVRGTVEISGELRRRLVRLPLKAEVYLDKDGKSVLGTVRFLYGEIALNPFAPSAEKVTLDRDDQLLMRDGESEHRVLEILANAGFRVRKESIRLSGTDAVYDFISEGVHRLQEICQVYMSRDFRRIMPRRVNLGGSIRMNGDHMELMLTRDGEATDEVLEILEALSRRRRYYRLKTGEFLDLASLADWQEMASVLYEAAVKDENDLNRDMLTLRSYRALYLTSMLEAHNPGIEVDESVRAMSANLTGNHGNIKAPELNRSFSLRDYQQRGYEWMYALDQMHMGGILADDMGLGKTIQVIALLLATQEAGRTSLVIAPTSLTYNWLSELKRFAPDLSAAVLSGTGVQRSRMIRHLTEHGDLDVVITSYPLIRRDIELMKDFCFRFVILDEAQNIKNAGSAAAQAVKQLKADTRFALTGTPMENGVGELWSLFDFVLPGYLPGYNAFLRRYQEGENAEDLLRRIRPFLTRRLKQDVLEELPDKMEITMTARMTPEQEQVYRAALERLRPKVQSLMSEKGAGRGRIEVLSAITELREICCHPALVMNDYRGGSGKVDMLLEILPDLIASGNRVLLFSQFTRMLRMLKTRLEESGYSLMYLDGETPAGERLALTERFNGGEGQIFLISLRAGGSGLNLTGADLVIHYDPWWNPATEDQATDRAHRIGQQKKVQVIRLVTGESIEEQVVELGNRKKALFERLIKPGENMLSALSEQEIISLFD